jgi:TatD DNase family protein
MTNDESLNRTDAFPSSFGAHPSPVRLVDTHCHLDWHAFDADRDAVIQRAIDAGVTRLVTIGVDEDSSRRAVKLAETYGAVYAAVGVHPNHAAEFGDEMLNEIRTLAAHPKVVAIGEIGLDDYWKTVDRDAQTKAFTTQLELAADIGKPVIIHSRDTTTGVLSILAQHVARHPSLVAPGVLHSFSGSLTDAQRAFGLGFLIGFSGPITFKKSSGLRELARAIPSDRYLIETDAPFLTPEPRRGRRNEPAYVARVAECIAQARAAPLAEVAAQTTASATQLFAWATDDES